MRGEGGRECGIGGVRERGRAGEWVTGDVGGVIG